jgi:hypothetical protein
MADVVLHPHTAAMKALLGEADSKSGAHLAKVLVEAIVKGLPRADVADEPPRNGRLLPVKRTAASTAEVRGSNPLRSTRKSAQTDVTSQGQK